MALAGVRVIELAGLAPTPFCGLMLADMGADVIRVDRASSDHSTDNVCRGKRSIQLDLKNPDGKECLRHLCSKADVLIEGFRPGVLESLSLSPESLLQINPRLIVARLSGYGQTGSLRNVAGHDMNYVAISGLLDFIGPAGKPPTFPANYLADFAGGSYLCAFAIVSALYSREKTGFGQVIDHAMCEGASYMNTFPSVSLPIFSDARGTNMLDGGAHFYSIYETKDGLYMTVGAIEPQFYSKLLQGMNFSPEDIANLPHQLDNSAWPDMKERFANIFKTKTQQEWDDIFGLSDACVQPVLTKESIAKHPHIIDRGMVKTQRNGLQVPAPAPKFSKTPAKDPSIAIIPTVGEHTIEVLAEYGYDNAQITNLLGCKAIKQRKSSNL